MHTLFLKERKKFSSLLFFLKENFFLSFKNKEKRIKFNKLKGTNTIVIIIEYR